MITHSQYDWDLYFLNIAKQVSFMSKDPSTKVGAVIVQSKKILATGYNGFPAHIPDLLDSYHNREIKYKLITHAEENALIQLKEYKTKLTSDELTMYIYPLKPCKNCFLLIQKENIKRIITVKHIFENNICNICNNNCTSIRLKDQLSTNNIIEELDVIKKTDFRLV